MPKSPSNEETLPLSEFQAFALAKYGAVPVHPFKPGVNSSTLPGSPATAAPETAPRIIRVTRTTRATGKAVQQTFHSLRGAQDFIATGLFENTSMRKGMCDDAAELIMGQRQVLRQTQFGPFLFTVDKTAYLRD